MNTSVSRTGFTLIEFLLFIGILAILGSTVVGLLVATQDARIRQRTISELEQNGANILHMMTRTVRRGEAILDPPSQETGSILAVQMASATEYPTLFLTNGSGQMLFVQADAVNELFDETLIMHNLLFRNTSTTEGKSVQISFDLSIMIPLLKPERYTRHFAAAVTLYPDDQSEAGGCGSCPAPTCINELYSWSYCKNEECTAAPMHLSCM